MSDSARSVDHATAGLGRRLLHNLSAQSGTYVLSMALGVTTTAVLSRRLGPEGFGGFKFLFAFIYFFQTINDLGINTILIRDLARTPERTRELVHNILGFKILLAIASTLVAWAVAAWWPALTPSVRWAVAIFALILPIQAMTLPIVTLRANVLIGRASMIEVVNRVTGFVFMMIAILRGHGLIAVTAALVLGELAGLSAVVATTHRFVAPIPAFDRRVWKEVLRSSLPLGVAGLLVSLVNRFDFIMLQLLDRTNGLTAVGYYAAAYQVTGLLERLPLFVMATLYPLMSRLAAEDPAALVAVYRRSLRDFALLTVPMVAGVTFLAPFGIRLLNGANFLPAVLPLRILVWSTACLYPAMTAGNLLIALGKPNKNLLTWAIAAPVNLGLNLLLIPKYGVPGAALSTAVSFFTVLVTSLAMAERELGEAVRRHKVVVAEPMPGAATSR